MLESSNWDWCGFLTLYAVIAVLGAIVVIVISATSNTDEAMGGIGQAGRWAVAILGLPSTLTFLSFLFQVCKQSSHNFVFRLRLCRTCQCFLVSWDGSEVLESCGDHGRYILHYCVLRGVGWELRATTSVCRGRQSGVSAIRWPLGLAFKLYLSIAFDLWVPPGCFESCPPLSLRVLRESSSGFAARIESLPLQT